MTSASSTKPLNTPALDDTPQLWLKAQDAENGELYAFVEDLTFSHPAVTPKAMEQALANCQAFLETLGANAVIKTRQLPDLPDALVIHLSDEKNFVLDAMAHVRAILRGDAFYRPFMNAKVPTNTYGTRLLSVRIEGVILATAAGAELMFNVKLLAIEVNPRTGVFTIVQVIEQDPLAAAS